MADAAFAPIICIFDRILGNAIDRTQHCCAQRKAPKSVCAGCGLAIHTRRGCWPEILTAAVYVGVAATRIVISYSADVMF